MNKLKIIINNNLMSLTIGITMLLVGVYGALTHDFPFKNVDIVEKMPQTYEKAIITITMCALGVLYVIGVLFNRKKLKQVIIIMMAMTWAFICYELTQRLFIGDENYATVLAYGYFVVIILEAREEEFLDHGKYKSN